MRRNTTLRLAVLGTVLSILLSVGITPAHARWGHELDLFAKTSDGWVGRGLASRSDDPSSLVVTKDVPSRAEHLSFTVRMRKHFQSAGNATIRGCDAEPVRYIVDGEEVTRRLKDGGLRLERLEPGDTRIRVFINARHVNLRCRLRVLANGRIHDALTLHFLL